MVHIKDKSLSENEKKDAKPSHGAATRALDWEKSKLPWRESAQGRAAIRLFSRGVMGAAFFAWGGKYARDALEDGVPMGMHNYSHSFEKGVENPWNLQADIKYPLKLVARAIDKGVAAPIKKTIEFFTGNEKLAERAVRFRPLSVKYRNINTKDFEHGGRSLGSEVVGITFDFFCASIGDALGRDIADSLDKNVQKSWIDEKGHIDPTKAAKAAGKAAWRYLSYNGGEDWAVSIPYAYFMKTQRWVLGKHISKHSDLDINENNNGAAFKVTTHGGETKVVGNYNATGIYDLQSRFTVYNMGTLLYREAYDWLGNMLTGHPTKLYGDPTVEDPHKTIGQKAQNVAKWMTRGVVKGFINMTPATPFFWITRTPQTAHKATFINQENGTVLGYIRQEKMPDGTWRNMRRDDGTLEYKLIKHDSLGSGNGFSADAVVHERRFTGKSAPHSPRGWETVGTPSVKLNPFRDPNFDYRKSPGGGVITNVLAPFGAANDWYRKKVVNLGGRFGFRESDMNRFANAQVSYTPYMYMKAETAHAWDTGKMDLSAERMIDGAFAGNWGEFKAGLGEVWNTILCKPLADPEREAEAQHRIRVDTSAADADITSSSDDYHIIQQQKARAAKKAEAATEKKHEGPAFSDVSSSSLGATKSAAHMDGLSWEERTVQGRKPSQQTQDPLNAMAKRQLSHVDRQRMSDFLATAIPPTKSIN